MSNRYTIRVPELTLMIKDDVAHLVINRPDRKNALNAEMWSQIPHLLADVKGVHALAIESATPGIFSAGADINEYRENAGDSTWGYESQVRVGEALTAIRSFPAPTFALVDGPCFGGGSGIASACDFRIATARSTFAITPTKLGMLYPYEEMVHLVDLVGITVAKQILYSGASFTAEWAQGVGFVDEVVSESELYEAFKRRISDLSVVSSEAVRNTKRLFSRISAGIRVEDEVAREAILAALESADHLEGLNAFLERRPPIFQTPDFKDARFQGVDPRNE